jgi:hypothetical protein
MRFVQSSDRKSDGIVPTECPSLINPASVPDQPSHKLITLQRAASFGVSQVRGKMTGAASGGRIGLPGKPGLNKRPIE